MSIEDEIKVPLAIRALRRSSVRRKVIEYLSSISPSCNYASEIARRVQVSPTNVLGAICGMGTGKVRYDESQSLVSLGMVELKIARKSVKFYGITPFGIKMVDTLKNNKWG